MLFRSFLVALVASATLSACDRAPSMSDLTALLPTGALPQMRWSDHPEAEAWTAAALLSVARHDAELASQTPADIDTYCPGYAKASLNNRRAFWVGLMSATAKMESSFNPAASGGGGRYIGLMQISPKTAQRAGCEATTAAALKNGPANLDCAVRIFAPHVGEDGMVAGKGRQGVARDWGPFMRADKRAAVAEWTRAQPFCAAPTRVASN